MRSIKSARTRTRKATRATSRCRVSRSERRSAKTARRSWSPTRTTRRRRSSRPASRARATTAKAIGRCPRSSSWLDKLPIGGIDVASVPHDPDAFLGARDLPRPAFLETSRSIPEVSLIRRYTDEEGGVGPSTPRPFLDVEAAFPITASAGGSDSRGIVIDPTPRLACKARVAPVGPGQTVEERDRQMIACARKPARVFIANRSPAALLVGEVGVAQGIDGAYDPDRLTIHTSVPLSAGPSRVYLAPIVDQRRRVRASRLRRLLRFGDDLRLRPRRAARSRTSSASRRGRSRWRSTRSRSRTSRRTPRSRSTSAIARSACAATASRTSRASPSRSFKSLDLDNAVPNPATYEKVVYTLGRPTNPKGT